MTHPAMLRGAQFAAVSCVFLASLTARAQPAPTPPTPPPSDTAPTPPTPPPPTPATPPPATPPTPPTPAWSGGGEGQVIPPGGGEHEGHPDGGRGHGRGRPCEPCGESHETRRPWLGGLGYASVGLMTGGFSNMKNTLAAPAVLGPGYDAAPTGFTFGGGGGGLLGRFWLGGKGFGLFVGTSDSDRGTTTLTGGGGGGEIGYAVISNQDWIVVPFAGLGGFGYTLKVKNTKNAPLTLYPGEVVPAGGESKYTAGFLTGELGIRASKLLFWSHGDRAGGFMVGAEIGYMSSLQRVPFVADSTGAGSPETAELRGGYLRLIIGGGSFSFHQKHADGEHEAKE